MPKFFERNKIFLAIVIAGLLITGAIRSLNRPIYAPTAQSDLSQNNQIKNLAAQVAPNNQKEFSDSPNDLYKVVKVIDGDTIVVDVSGKIETIRLIGIDAPEIVDAKKTTECLGKQASNRAKEVLAGKNVKLGTDESQGERDKYGRLLHYVFLEDGTNFNKMMIEQGLAKEYNYKIPYKYQNEFKQAEKEAKEAKKGLWGPDVCESAQSGVLDLTPWPTASPQKQTNYICSYNFYNCADFTTHSEAQAAFEACGGVNNDIHSLDRDKDGLACESLP